MNRKRKIFVLINILIISLVIPKVVRGVYCDILTFETDKATYYVDEKIIISASWELIYDPEYERAFIQILIYNNSELLIWNSSRYGEIGVFQDNWTVTIHSLNLSFLNSFEKIYIKLINIIRDEGSGDEEYIVKCSLLVEIYKREISCELDGFSSIILYGQNLLFSAKFVDSLNHSDLINQTIYFHVYSNNISIYDDFFITNQTGIIELNLSSLNHLNVGPNILIFSISDNKLYNDSNFLFDLFVEKLSILTEIINFNENLENFNDFEIMVYYFYYFSNVIHPLIDTIIEVQFFQDNEFMISNTYKTNNSGILYLNGSIESFNLSEKKSKITIQFIYNGTDTLNSNIFNLYLDLGLNQSIENMDTVQFTLIFTISFIGVTLSVFSFYLFNKKRTNIKDLSDLTIKF